jgi:putative peptide zinc metalloprotease protein
MTSPAAPLAGAPGRALPRPRRRPGIELMGSMPDTGFAEEQFLLQTPDGQYCRLSPLLYRTVEAADGTRDTEAMAEYVSVAVGKQVSSDNIEWLLRERLGWLVMHDDWDTAAAGDHVAAAPPEARNPLLALRFRKAVVSARTMTWAATPFQFLFTAPAVVAIIVVGLYANWWLWNGATLSSALDATFRHPLGPLMAVGLILLATVFHEIGHATALKKGGGRPGVMGVGLYLAWPAFYTDVSDSYRLPRWWRVRVGLGGIYFNLIFSMMMIGLARVTDFAPLLLVAVLVQIEAVYQLLPLVRLDGYWILADMLGVPDLFSHIKTHVAAVRRTRSGQSAGAALLRRGPARAFGIYVITVLPMMMVFLGGLLWSAPRILATAAEMEAEWLGKLGQAALRGNEVELLTAGVQSLMLLLGPLAIVLSLGLFFTRTVKGLRRWGAVSFRRGLMASGVAAAIVSGLFFAWVPANVRADLPDDIVRVAKSVGEGVENLRDRDDPTIRRGATPMGEAAPRRTGESR